MPEGATITLEPFGLDDDGSSRTIYGNGWFMSTGMGWLSRRLTKGLDVGPRVDRALEGITPRSLLSGYAQDARGDVLAGHYLGWLHRIRATIAGVAHGRGAALVCTFPLLEHDTSDPLATAMLDRLTTLVREPGFSPRTRI